jgi:hypothetical protein
MSNQQSVYPRSRLFRVYEADIKKQVEKEQVSMAKPYPRSRLFREYEAAKVSMAKSYPRSRLFRAYEEQVQNVLEKKQVVQESEHVTKKVCWGDESEDFDFTNVTNIYKNT